MKGFDSIGQKTNMIRQRCEKNQNSLIPNETKDPNFKYYEGNQDETNDNNKLELNDLNLMEEILLLGLKDKAGYTSLWNVSICAGLRACILIELGLKNRIGLEKTGRRKRRLLSRKVIVKDDQPIGDSLLDEALKRIKEADRPETIDDWIGYFNGDTYTWSPTKIRYQLKNVRERVAKTLVEKRVLTTEKRNFLLFSLTAHPIIKPDVKSKIIRKIQDALLVNWEGNAALMDPKTLALIIIAHTSDVLEHALVSLEDDHYDLAARRLNKIYDLNFDAEAAKPESCDIVWAVFAALKQT